LDGLKWQTHPKQDIRSTEWMLAEAHHPPDRDP